MTKPIGKSESVVGTWRLISIRVEFNDTGESADMYGANPKGFLVLTERGRMMAIVTAGDRTAPKTEADRAALFEGMMAYTGEYRVDGDSFVTAVDVAWHPAWTGEQTRFFTVDGDRLSIITPQQNHPRYPGRACRGVLEWHRD